MRFPKFLAVVAMVSVVSVGVISAQEEVATINDGRVNSRDLAATVIAYCSFDHPDVDDPDASELAAVELWGLNGESYFEQVVYVTADAIDAAGVNSEASTLLGTGNGYSLYREADGSFTAVAPGDAEGKVYLFNWERGDQNC